MSLIDDAYELYDSRGGTMDRETYSRAVRLVLRMALFLLGKGKRVAIDDATLRPFKRERIAGDRHSYYLPGYVPDIEVNSERYRITVRKSIKQQLLGSYENIPLP